jgi:hypothetical protein
MFFKKKTKRAFELWNSYKVKQPNWMYIFVNWAYVDWVFNPEMAYKIWMEKLIS